MTTAKQYYAFISYKRDDQKWAEWLQEKLEHYKLPSNLNGRGDLPKEIRPVFRDKSELAAGVLADEIQKALDNSKYLIVICSPHSAKSEWVNKEVQAFIDSGRTDKIIPFIIEGVPNSNNEETECFPKAIRELPAEDELLGVNINEMGRDAAAVKVVAQMFGLRFDDLWQRHEREKRRKRNCMIFAGVFAFLLMAGIALWMYMQRQETLKANWKMLENQSKLVAKEVIAGAQDDSYLARLVALEILPQNVANPIDRPYTPDAERALRKACEYNSAKLKFADNVVSAVFSPDGEKIIAATMSIDSAFTVKSYDENSGSELSTIIDNERNIDLLKMCDDGKHVITVNNSDSTICIRRVDCHKMKTIKINAGKVNALAVSDDMIEMLVIANDSTMHLINIESGNEIIRNVSLSKYIDAAFSKDGKRVVCSFCDDLYGDTYVNSCDSIFCYSSNKISVFDVSTGKELKSWSGHKNIIYSIEYYDNEIITASFDGTVVIWDALKGSKLSSSVINESSMMCVKIGNDGNRIVSTTYNGEIVLMDKALKEIMRLRGHTSGAISLCYNYDNTKLLSVSADKTIRLWGIEGLEKANIKEKTNLNNAFFNFYKTCDVNNNYIAYYKDDTTLNIKDLTTWENVKYFKTENSIFSPVDFSNDGNYLAALSANFTLKIWDVKTEDEIHSINMCDLVTSTNFSTNNENIAVAMNNGKYAIMNLNNDIEPKLFKCKFGAVGSAKFCPDGSTIYISSEKIFSIDTNRYIETVLLNKHTNMVFNIMFSPDGKNIISSSWDRTLIKWDYETGREIFTFIGHNDHVYYASYSHDGKYIASASADKTVRVWNAETGDCLHIIEGHTDVVNFVAFTPDDRHIISASTDGTIRLWDFPPLQELIDSTRERFKNRPLTDEEKKMYYLE